MSKKRETAADIRAQRDRFVSSPANQSLPYWRYMLNLEAFERDIATAVAREDRAAREAAIWHDGEEWRRHDGEPVRRMIGGVAHGRTAPAESRIDCHKPAPVATPLWRKPEEPPPWVLIDVDRYSMREVTYGFTEAEMFRRGVFGARADTYRFVERVLVLDGLDIPAGEVLASLTATEWRDFRLTPLMRRAIDESVGLSLATIGRPPPPEPPPK